MFPDTLDSAEVHPIGGGGTFRDDGTLLLLLGRVVG
jgi:hypothetical protein